MVAGPGPRGLLRKSAWMIITCMWGRWSAFGVWAVVAATAVFWGLRVFVHGQPAPAQTQVARTGALVRGDLTRILGNDAPVVVAAAPAEPAPDARFQLIGVVSPRSPQAVGEGVALIAVDGKTAKAYRVGAAVDGNTVLQSVRPRGATLGPRNGPALVALEIAALPPAATGALPVGLPSGLPGASGIGSGEGPTIGVQPVAPAATQAGPAPFGRQRASPIAPPPVLPPPMPFGVSPARPAVFPPPGIARPVLPVIPAGDPAQGAVPVPPRPGGDQPANSAETTR